MPTEENKFSQTIFDYVRLAKVEELESCVKRGGSINEVEKSKDKFTPLHYACYYGSLECLHWLLWQGADYTMTTTKGWTPGHIAAIRGQYACIQALVKNGVNMNVRDNRGQTPAHLACTHGHSHTLQAIIRSGADIHMQDSNGWTPMHTAAFHGRLGCLQFLKTSGGKFDECDNDGNTPAHLAAMEGNLHCLKYILSNTSNMNFLLSARNDQGDTPKTLAQQFYKDEVSEYLEAVEWDRDHPEQAENLAFPAHVAAFNGDLDHIKLLVDRGVININEKDDKGSTIAHKASGQGHIHVLKWLIENGADLKLTNQAGETARDVAKRFAQLASIKLLEEEIGEDEDEGYHKADLNMHTESQEPILLSHEQKKEAKLRAKTRLEEVEKQYNIAKSNFIQLGGRLEENPQNDYKTEMTQIKEQARTIDELRNEIEFERLKREKLEAQLDLNRQELEKSHRTIRDYETKVTVLERYIHQTAKQEAKNNKKNNSNTNTKSSTTNLRSRSKSNLSKARNETKSPQKKSSKHFYEERPHSSQKEYEPKSHEYDYRPSPAKRFNILNNLTSSQLNELRRAFDEIDVNGSGSISRKELRRAFRDLDIRASDDEIEVVLNQMDNNHDGKIDFEEFAKVMAKNYYRKNTKEDIIEAFRKFDLNNSGLISAEEMRVVLSKMHRFYSREEVEELIRRVDRNKDGLLSIDEFADLLNLN